MELAAHGAAAAALPATRSAAAAAAAAIGPLHAAAHVQAAAAAAAATPDQPATSECVRSFESATDECAAPSDSEAAAPDAHEPSLEPSVQSPAASTAARNIVLHI